MPWARKLLMRMFGRPKGVLGRLGGVIMARVNRDAAAQVIALLDVRPDDVVLEVGTGLGYQSAILAELAGMVCVELVEDLGKQAKGTP